VSEDEATHAGANGRAPVVVRPETPGDHAQVRTVHTSAFGDGGHVSDLVDALRDAPATLAPTSLVAVLGDRLVGHVMLSAARLDAPPRIVDVLVLSPLGVLPDHQGQGVGTALVRASLTDAERRGAPLVFLEGSPQYYASRGFARADVLGFRAPSLRIPARAFQVARLGAYEPWMTGTLVYSEPFCALDCVGLRDADLHG